MRIAWRACCRISGNVSLARFQHIHKSHRCSGIGSVQVVVNGLFYICVGKRSQCDGFGAHATDFLAMSARNLAK